MLGTSVSASIWRLRSSHRSHFLHTHEFTCKRRLGQPRTSNEQRTWNFANAVWCIQG